MRGGIVLSKKNLKPQDEAHTQLLLELNVSRR